MRKKQIGSLNNGNMVNLTLKILKLVFSVMKYSDEIEKRVMEGVLYYIYMNLSSLSHVVQSWLVIILRMLLGERRK